MKQATWSPQMYHCLALLILKRTYENSSEWIREESKTLETLLLNSREKLTSIEQRLVENRARRIDNDFHENALYTLEKMYSHELDNSGYLFPPITYDEKVYETWSQAVRKKETVSVIYESTTSGLSNRLIDPYKTQSPYGIGYCHSRKAVRKFRFDRIIDIKLTNKIFIKPKNWQHLK